MKKRGVIITLLILSCIIFGSLVFMILKYNKTQAIIEDDKVNTNVNTRINANTNTSTSTNNTTMNNSIYSGKVDEKTSKEIEEEIKKIKITIENTPDEIVKSIKNRDDFVYAIKKFLYQNNLADLKELIFLNHLVNNNKLYLYYRGYKDKKIYFEIAVDLETNKTSVCFGGD